MGVMHVCLAAKIEKIQNLTLKYLLFNAKGLKGVRSLTEFVV